MKATTFEEWSATAEITQPTLQVGPAHANHSRSFWDMNGVAVYEDDVMPHNWFKSSRAWCYVDLLLDLTEANKELVESCGGELVLMPYSEDKYWPYFERTDKESKTEQIDPHMRRAFEFVIKYLESRNTVPE